MSSIIYLLFGLGLLFVLAGGLVFYGIFFMFGGGGDIADRMQAYVRSVGSSTDQGREGQMLSGFRLRLNEWLSIFASEDLDMELMSADWQITYIEYTLLRLLGVVLSFLFGWIVFQSILPGVGLAILIYFLPAIALRMSVNRRQNRFDNQLVDVLVLLTGGIRAGYSFLQALDHVIQELPPPASVEFGRVRQEIRLGISMREALFNLSERMENQDLSLVITAITITQQVGGNMTQMMEVVTDTIRARNRLFSEVKSLTSQQRFTGQMLSLLPVLVGGILFLINPSYMSRIFDPRLIWLPVAAGISVIIGNIIIRRMVKVEY